MTTTPSHDFEQLTAAVRDLIALSEVQMRLIRHQNEVMVKLIRTAGEAYYPDGAAGGADIRDLRALFVEAYEVYRQGADYVLQQDGQKEAERGEAEPEA